MSRAGVNPCCTHMILARKAIHAATTRTICFLQCCHVRDKVSQAHPRRVIIRRHLGSLLWPR